MLKFFVIVTVCLIQIRLFAIGIVNENLSLFHFSSIPLMVNVFLIIKIKTYILQTLLTIPALFLTLFTTMIMMQGFTDDIIYTFLSMAIVGVFNLLIPYEVFKYY